MSKIQEIFEKAISPFKKTSDSRKAYDDLDKGKSININLFSDRYTYENKGDTEYDKDWIPEKEEEKSPEGYFTKEEADDKRKELIQGIYESALRQKTDKPEEATAEQKLEAKEEADDIFDEQYEKKQISIPSTALKNIKYDPDTELLQVVFQGSSKVYDYPAVPLELVQGLLKASSKGKYFLANIHDQYSMYGKDHSKKATKQQLAIRHYAKRVKPTNGLWQKIAANKGKYINKER